MKSIFKIVSGTAAVAMMFGVVGCRSAKPEPNPYTGLMSGRSNVPPASRTVSYSSSLPKSLQEANELDAFVAPQIGDNADSLIVPVATPVELTDDITPADSVEEAPAAPASRPAQRVLPAVSNGKGIVKNSSSEGNVYVVQKGDYVSKIAKMYGVKVSDLKAANPQVSNFERIYVGQKLNIPAGGATAKVVSGSEKKVTSVTPVAVEAAPADGIYTVCSGDAISKIAKRFGVKSDDIRRWNDLTSDKLFVGQKLRVKGDAAAPKAVSTPKVEAPVAGAAPVDVIPAAAVEQEKAPASEVPGDEAPVVDDIGGTDALAASEPVENAAPVGTIFPHILSEGETLESIADMYGTTVESILEVNPQIKGNADLKPGEQIMTKLK